MTQIDGIERGEMLVIWVCQKRTHMSGTRGKENYGRNGLLQRPAHVAQWSTRSGAMCSEAWRASGAGFKDESWATPRSKNYK